MTREQVMRIWLDGRSAGTVTVYGYYMDVLDQKAQETFKKGIIELSAIELRALMMALQPTMKPVSYACKVAMVRSFFKFMFEEGLLAENPAAKLRRPKFEDVLADKILTHGQVEMLLAAAKPGQEQLMVKTFYLSGIRSNELCGLRGKDVLKKESGSGEVFYQLRIQFSKSQATQLVGIPAALGRLLEGRPGDSYIFSDHPVGRYPLNRQQVWYIFKRLGKILDIPRLSPHWLRHTHATEALKGGASLVMVQRQLRHKSSNTTVKYAHLREEESASRFLPTLK